MLDVGRSREVGEALGKVDGATSLGKVGELLDGRGEESSRCLGELCLHFADGRCFPPARIRGSGTDEALPLSRLTNGPGPGRPPPGLA